MSEVSNDPNGGGDTVGPGRLLEVIEITPDDLSRAASIPADACPRRYCWWWVSLSFDWQLTASEGCTFLKVKKLPGWQYADLPCCRSDAASPIDHFEPRDPQIEVDGVDASQWLKYRAEQDART